MKLARGLVLVLGISLSAAACAAGAGGTGSAPGAGLKETRYSTAAKLQLARAASEDPAANRAAYEAALQQSLEGIQAVPDNPQHFFLAGTAYAGLGDVAAADSMWNRALEMHPAYAADIDEAREQAWARSFNEGVNAYNSGDVQGAITAWQNANRLYNKRPEAYFNLAAVYTEQQQYDQAIQAYRESLAALDRTPERELTPEETAERKESRESALTNLGQLLINQEKYAEAEQLYRQALEANPNDIAAQSNLAVALAKQGKKDEAMATYDRLLNQPNATANDLFNVGVGLFQVEDYARAAQAFKRITEMNPNNRDAWYNYANALYAQKQWQALVPVAEKLAQIDPLNESALLILANAYKETKQNQKALEVLERNEALPIHVEGLQLRGAEGRTTLRGTATPKKAAAGTPVQLRFTFYGDAGELGTQTVTVNAPAAGQNTTFDAAFENPAQVTGYRYEVVR
ncbi:MAG TPA: tetratricopeptide repeat protein [Longimicrobiaceae bacterium]|jgi:tetratricopeptide (TPR) repeat protein|nr:tetratricopeptide repeat protein [Longimicrobiaceae bacterium]